MPKDTHSTLPADAELVLPEQVKVALAETPAEVADQVDKVATTLQPRFPAVAGLLTEAKAVTRLATAVRIEAHDEWQIADRRYLSEGSMAVLGPIRDDGGRPKEVRRATAELVVT
jgi:hypothetical protein